MRLKRKEMKMTENQKLISTLFLIGTNELPVMRVIATEITGKQEQLKQIDSQMTRSCHLIH